jgi:hypothetical protein
MEAQSYQKFKRPMDGPRRQSGASGRGYLKHISLSCKLLLSKIEYAGRGRVEEGFPLPAKWIVKMNKIDMFQGYTKEAAGKILFKG